MVNRKKNEKQRGQFKRPLGQHKHTDIHNRGVRREKRPENIF